MRMTLPLLFSMVLAQPLTAQPPVPQAEPAKQPAKPADPDEVSWKGIDILPKRPGIKLLRPDAGGVDVVVAELEPEYYRVREDKDDKLRIVTRRGIEGWIEVKDALPVSDAEDYFTQMIQREPRKIWGYLCRAVARDLEDAGEEAIDDLDEAIRL